MVPAAIAEGQNDIPIHVGPDITSAMPWSIVVDGLRITKECAPEEQKSRPNHKWEKRHGDVGAPPSIADPGMSTDAHSDEGRE
jgi:hypothetical protein